MTPEQMEPGKSYKLTLKPGTELKRFPFPVSEEDDVEQHTHVTEGKCIHGLTWRGQFDGILADGLVDDMAHWTMLNDCAEKHGDLAVVDDK